MPICWFVWCAVIGGGKSEIGISGNARIVSAQFQCDVSAVSVTVLAKAQMNAVAEVNLDTATR